MINRRSIVAAAAAISICLTFAGCGDTSETGSAENAGTTTAAAETDNLDNAESEIAEEESEAQAEPEQEIEEEVQSEPEEESEADESMIYALLSLEWDKGLRTYTADGQTILGACETNDGKIFIWDRETYEIYTYDPETEKVKDLWEMNNATYYNGYLYMVHPLRKLNTDGIVLSNNELTKGWNGADIAITDDGEVAAVTKIGLAIVSADFQSLTNYDPPQHEDSSGNTEDITMRSTVGYYNNKIYVICEDPDNIDANYDLYSFDMSTHEWQMVIKMPTEKFTSGDLIGKYWIFYHAKTSTYIMDLEKGTIIAELPQEKLYRNYVGGDRPANYDMDSNTMVCPVNENTYVMRNSHGVFLCVEGEDDIKIVSY